MKITKRKGSNGMAIIYTAIFIFFVSLASNINEIESMLFFDFAKDLSDVGSPTVRFAEIAIVLAGIGFLVLAIEVITD